MAHFIHTNIVLGEPGVNSDVNLVRNPGSEGGIFGVAVGSAQSAQFVTQCVTNSA
jgi:hypothetical protein